MGIDVGGTKIAAGLVDSKFKVSKLKNILTSQTNFLKQLTDLIGSYSDYSQIGLGVPGRVSKTGMIKRLPNIKNFKSLNLKRYLENKYKVPVGIINDAEAFTLAEANLSDKKFKKIFGVILGTGIGGGLVVNNVHKNVDSLLHRKLPGLEQRMQKYGPFKRSVEARPFIQKLLPIILNDFGPNLIVFGGARSMLPGMQTILKQCLKSGYPYPLKTSVKISRLKHAGIIGAVLPLLKK